MIDDDDQVPVALAVGELVDPDPPQPGQRSVPAAASAATRVMMRPMVRHPVRISSQMVALQAAHASQAMVSSNARVCRAPCRAHARRDRHAVPGAGHPWRGAFQLGPDRAQVQGPPPAPLALVIARAAAPADPAPPGPAPVRTRAITVISGSPSGPGFSSQLIPSITVPLSTASIRAHSLEFRMPFPSVLPV